MARKKVLTTKQFAEVATGVRLSSHERICSERMKLLLENIKEMRIQIRELETAGKDPTEAIIEVAKLQEELKSISI